MVDKIQRYIAVTIIAIFSSLSIIAITPVQNVHAAECVPDQSILGIPTWYKYLDHSTDGSGQCNPSINDSSDALPIGLAVLEAAIRAAGLVAVVMIFISSFKFITSQGNGDSAKEARMTAINALIGLVIVIVATSVITFIGNNLGVTT
jgi:hypothetical protein